MKRKRLNPRIIGLLLLLLCFLGMKAQSRLEYWFDNDYSKPATIPISVGSESMQELELDLTNNVKFPLGFHRLNYRVVVNGEYSPIYSDCVMRLPDGQANQITYWLDDNYKGRRVMKGIPLNAKITYFIGNLDFSTTPVGMHRFKYRVTVNGFDDGVVYEEPVLITKMYNNVTEAKIVSESYWFNENTPTNKEVTNPQTTYTKSYVLNPDNYAVGQYAFHVQYKNSADVWCEPNVTYFYKEESGMLRAGFFPGDFDGMGEATIDEHFICTNQEGVIFVDCQSSKLASTGIIMIYDMTGKVLARKDVSNTDGIHAEININGIPKQLLVVRLLSGEAQFTKKIMVR